MREAFGEWAAMVVMTILMVIVLSPLVWVAVRCVRWAIS